MWNLKLLAVCMLDATARLNSYAVLPYDGSCVAYFIAFHKVASPPSLVASLFLGVCEYCIVVLWNYVFNHRFTFCMFNFTQTNESCIIQFEYSMCTNHFLLICSHHCCCLCCCYCCCYSCCWLFVQNATMIFRIWTKIV